MTVLGGEGSRLRGSVSKKHVELGTEVMWLTPKLRSCVTISTITTTVPLLRPLRFMALQDSNFNFILSTCIKWWLETFGVSILVFCFHFHFVSLTVWKNMGLGHQSYFRPHMTYEGDSEKACNCGACDTPLSGISSSGEEGNTVSLCSRPSCTSDTLTSQSDSIATTNTLLKILHLKHLYNLPPLCFTRKGFRTSPTTISSPLETSKSSFSRLWTAFALGPSLPPSFPPQVDSFSGVFLLYGSVQHRGPWLGLSLPWAGGHPLEGHSALSGLSRNLLSSGQHPSKCWASWK